MCFYEDTIKIWVSCFWRRPDTPLPRLTHLTLSLYFRSSEAIRGPLKGAESAQKALDWIWSKTGAKELLGGSIREPCPSCWGVTNFLSMKVNGILQNSNRKQCVSGQTCNDGLWWRGWGESSSKHWWHSVNVMLSQSICLCRRPFFAEDQDILNQSNFLKLYKWICMTQR